MSSFLKYFSFALGFHRHKYVIDIENIFIGIIGKAKLLKNVFYSPDRNLIK